MTARQPETSAADRAVTRSRIFKDRLAAGETVYGAWLTIPDVAVAEIYAGAGFDFVVIDAEHSPWTTTDIQLALAGFTGSPTVVLVRPAALDPVYITPILDVGGDGILCPSVRSASEAERLVRITRYPPEGTRGFGPRRASRYGRDVDFYAANANRDVIVVPQIEDAAVLPEVDAILDLDGIDAICLGPTDLSGSLGLLRQFDHPDVVAAIDAILAKAKSRNTAVCTGIVVDSEAVSTWVEKGARMPLITADTSLLVDGAAACLARARAVSV